MPRIPLKTISLFAFLTLLSACSSDSDENNLSSGAPCGLVEIIAPAAIVNGVLAGNDCTADRTFPDPSAGDFSFVDEYEVTLAAAGTLTITMRSTDVDPFLLLLSNADSCLNGCDTDIVIATDNNTGGGTTAFISMDLAAGTYGIHANSIQPASGNYSLETTFTP